MTVPRPAHRGRLLFGEGSGVAARLTASPDGVAEAGSMDGGAYEQWVVICAVPSTGFRVRASWRSV